MSFNTTEEIMINIGSEVRKTNRFELVVLVRDNEGLPTGKKKTFVTESPDELELLWNRNSGRVKKKRKKVNAAKTEKEIQTAVQEVSNHIEKIRKQRRLED
jgi:hypothetical protein